LSSPVRDVREPAQPARILPGTQMRKAVPPRMVGPYLSGQRAVIAGYVHRLRDVQLRTPAEAYALLGLGYEGSDFRPDMAEMYFLCWNAREIDGYVPVYAAARTAEFYLEAIQIPVGTILCRLTNSGDEPVARYDGLAWRRQNRPEQTGARRALPADGVLPGIVLSGGRWSVVQRGNPVRGDPAA
jgi:hypothetical protein